MPRVIRHMCNADFIHAGLEILAIDRAAAEKDIARSRMPVQIIQHHQIELPGHCENIRAHFPSAGRIADADKIDHSGVFALPELRIWAQPAGAAIKMQLGARTRRNPRHEIPRDFRHMRSH